jgi:hypothetical protein
MGKKKNNKLKKKIINYLSEEYSEEDAIKQVCFAKIEKIKIIKVTYDNGVFELLEKKGDELKEFSGSFVFKKS